MRGTSAELRTPKWCTAELNIQNVHLQKAEYENTLIQLNEGLDVFAAVMTMSRLEKANVFSFVANVFSFVVLLIFVICAGSLHTMTSLPCCIHRLAVVRSVHCSLWSGPYTVM